MKLMDVLLDKYQKNIVIKSTSQFLLASFLIALAISLASATLLKRYQYSNILESVKQLTATVENSCNIAAFTNDKVLAAEVVKGLLTNKILAQVSINSISPETQKIQPLVSLPDSQPLTAPSYSQKLHSPFNSQEKIGEINIWVSENTVQSMASEYSNAITFILFGTLSCLTLVLSWVIYKTIIQPIKNISDEIHLVDIEKNAFINVPKNNHKDEIGRLVADTNQLIHRLKDILKNEQELAIKHFNAQQQLQCIFEQAQTGIFLITLDMQLVSYNPAFADLLNINQALLVNKQHLHTLAILPDDIQSIFYAKVNQLTAKKQPLTFIANLEKDNPKWLEFSISLVEDGQKIQGIVNDITYHKMAEMAAIDSSEKDPLTQVLNRRGFEPRLNKMIERADSFLESALLIVDLDGFKQINDAYGHKAGDYVLLETTKRMEECIRKSDLLARLGGDEFAIGLPAIENSNNACMLANKIIQSLSKPILYNNTVLLITASIGIVMIDGYIQDIERITQHADDAMYLAKQAGKAQYRLSVV